jgi:hypothetical protein
LLSLERSVNILNLKPGQRAPNNLTDTRLVLLGGDKRHVPQNVSRWARVTVAWENGALLDGKRVDCAWRFQDGCVDVTLENPQIVGGAHAVKATKCPRFKVLGGHIREVGVECVTIGWPDDFEIADLLCERTGLWAVVKNPDTGELYGDERCHGVYWSKRGKGGRIVRLRVILAKGSAVQGNASSDDAEWTGFRGDGLVADRCGSPEAGGTGVISFAGIRGGEYRNVHFLNCNPDAPLFTCHADRVGNRFGPASRDNRVVNYTVTGPRRDVDVQQSHGSTGNAMIAGAGFLAWGDGAPRWVTCPTCKGTGEVPA